MSIKPYDCAREARRILRDFWLLRHSRHKMHAFVIHMAARKIPYPASLTELKFRYDPFGTGPATVALAYLAMVFRRPNLSGSLPHGD